DLPETRYPDGASRSRFYRNWMDRASSLPGVVAATVIDNLPLHSVGVNNFYIVGRPEPLRNALPIADTAHASPNYFRAIGLRLISGRLFTEEDLALNEKEKDGVAIVNQAFARQFFNGEAPSGERLRSGDKKHVWEIIGVVSNYRPMGVENGTRPQIFLPYLRLN